MKAEHCSKAGSKDEFETLNYAIKSTPYREWCLVVDKEKVVPEPDMRYGRRIPDIDELMTLDVAKRAKLSRPEVIAVVLYTGPLVIAPPRKLALENALQTRPYSELRSTTFTTPSCGGGQRKHTTDSRTGTTCSQLASPSW
jgi:hypothetical protein